MPPRLPDSLRWGVIEFWLLGYSRNSIALQFKISSGSVSAIVEEWGHSIGPDTANLLRGLAVTLRKLGMSPAQCTSGLRIFNLISKMGLDVNSIEVFLTEVYARLQELDVNPKFIARYVEGLLSFLDDMNLGEERSATLSIRNIDEIFVKRRRYNADLNEEFKTRKSKLEDINQQLDQSEKKIEELFEQNRLVEQEIEWKSELRGEMRKYGLDVSNISRLVECARFFRDNRCDLSELVRTFSRYEEMLRAIMNQELELQNLKNTSFKIRQQNAIEEDLLQQKRLKNAELESLKAMGFGLGELKTLHNVIVEVAAENGQSTGNGEEVRNFISDIENHYHDYLRLREKVNDLKSQQSIIITFNSLASDLGQASMNFLRKRGITQDDVKNMIKMLEIYAPGTISNADFESSLKQYEPSQHDKVKGHQFPSPPKIPKRFRPLRTSSHAGTLKQIDGQVQVNHVSPADSPDVFIPQYIKPVTDIEDEDDRA